MNELITKLLSSARAPLIDLLILTNHENDRLRIENLWLWRLVKVAVLILAVIFFSVLAMPTFADETDPPKWGLRPEAAGVGWFDLTLAPGATFSDALILSNLSDQTIRLGVYPVAGITAQRGGFSLSDEPGGASEWLTLEESGLVVLGAGEVLRIPFVLTVPADAPAGDVGMGVIAAEPLEDFGSSDDFGVVVRKRVGVSVIVRVAGDSYCELAVDDVQLIEGRDGLMILVGLRNQGNRVVTGDGAVSLTREGGGAEPLFTSDLPLGFSLPGLPISYPVYTSVDKRGKIELEVAMWANEFEDCQFLYSKVYVLKSDPQAGLDLSGTNIAEASSLEATISNLSNFETGMLPLLSQEKQGVRDAVAIGLVIVGGAVALGFAVFMVSFTNPKRINLHRKGRVGRARGPRRESKESGGIDGPPPSSYTKIMEDLKRD